MRDYNYFALVKKRSKKQRGRSKKTQESYIKFLIAAGILALIAWPVITQIRLSNLDNQINKYSQALVQDPGYPLFYEVEQKQAELARSQSIVSSLRQASNMILEKEVINEKLFEVVTAILPVDTQLTGLTLSGQNVGMTGTARSRAAVAELIYNLRNTGRFRQFFITSLNENDGLYPFSLNLELIGGAIR